MVIRQLVTVYAYVVCSLNEKSTELLTAKEEFKLKEADLIHQIEGLKHQVEGLKHQVEELKNACKKYVAIYIHTYIHMYLYIILVVT